MKKLTTKMFLNLFTRNILYVRLFSILTIAYTTNLFSQENGSVEKSNSKSRFSFTIKQANYTYYPEEYATSIGLRDKYDSFRNSGFDTLRNKSDVINPFSFYYYNENKNLYFEVSHYKLILSDPYYYYVQPIFPDKLTLVTFSLGNLKRQETKLNVYSSISLNENNQIFYGIGIRNLYKEQSSHILYSQNFTSANTNGLQGFLKYQYKILKPLSLNFSLEPFYTYGNRRIESTSSVSSDFNSIVYRFDNSNSKVYFYGAELDFNFSFQFYENLSLLIGYDFIYTKVRYENDRRLNIIYNNGQISPPRITSPFLKTTDHIENYYIGLNAKF